MLPSGTGDEKPKQHQLLDPGPQNSCEGPTNDEVCPPQPDSKSETKKVELLVSLYIHEAFLSYFILSYFQPWVFEDI